MGGVWGWVWGRLVEWAMMVPRGLTHSASASILLVGCVFFKLCMNW